MNTGGYRSDGELRLLANKARNLEEFRAMSHRAAESKRRRHYPTLSASDYKGLYKLGQRRGQLTDALQDHGMLNPQWAEWFMGYQIGWTEFAPLETP